MSKIETYCQITYNLSLVAFLQVQAKAGLTATEIARLLFASPTYIAQKAKQLKIKLHKKKLSKSFDTF